MTGDSLPRTLAGHTHNADNVTSNCNISTMQSTAMDRGRSPSDSIVKMY